MPVNIIHGAIAVIYRDSPRGRLYLVTRNVFSGNYTFPGGASEPGEDLLSTVKRELFEEINITPNDDEIEELPLTNSFVFSMKNSNRYKLPAQYKVFLIRTENEKIEPNTEQVAEVRWLPYSEARQLVKHQILKINLDWVEQKLNQ